MLKEKLFNLFDSIESKIDFTEMKNSDEYKCRYEHVTRELLLDQIIVHSTSTMTFDKLIKYINNKVRYFTMDELETPTNFFNLLSDDKKMSILIKYEDGHGIFSIKMLAPMSVRSLYQHIFTNYSFSTCEEPVFSVVSLGKDGKVTEELSSIQKNT